MKHDRERTALLISLAGRAGIDLEAAQAETCIAYLLELLAENQRVNLTRIVDPDVAVSLHVLDSLLALPELQSAPPGEFLDLGSGGGFPGVPLSIASSRGATLLDSVGKKAAAVAGVLERTGLASQVSAIAARAEDHAKESRGHYAAVVARAVARLPSLVELAAPLLMEGGVLISLKGRPESTERESGAVVAAKVGMMEQSWRAATLPPGDEIRTIVVYRRCGDSTIPLPRRSGMAQKRPLG